MKKINIIIVSLSVGFGLMCFVWGLLWMVMANDLKEQLIELEQEVIQLRWENEQIDQMICIKGEK